MSDGTHQCSACVVKLSVSHRLTDMVNPSIATAERAGLEVQTYKVKDMQREKKKRETGAFRKPCFVLFRKHRSNLALK